MRIRKALAKTCSAALAAAMLMAGVPEAAGIQTPFAVTAQAAKKKTVKKKKKVKKVKKKYKENPKLSKTRLSIRNKKTATVKVSGTKKGISVTSSDKSIATVSRSGKYAFRVKASKKKKGVAVIRVKTSRGYKYVFVQVGGRTNMSSKTRTWAQAGGFIAVPQPQPSTPQAQQPQTVPSVPAQPSVTQPQPQPGTRQPEAQPQTTPGTKVPETQPETKTPETQSQTTPETKAPETQPETKAPETQPETTPETQPETKQSETQKQTESEATPVTRASLYDSSLEARKAYDLKVATQCGFFDNSVPYKQKIQNMMHWMENNVNYDLNNVGCWQAFYQYADNTTYFSDLHKNWPDEYPEGVLCYDGAGYILNFACYFLNLKGTLFRADTPGIGWVGHIAAAVYLPAQGSDPEGWYVINPSYKNYGTRNMKVERITEQSNKTWYDDIIKSVTDYEPQTRQSTIDDNLMHYWT